MAHKELTTKYAKQLNDSQQRIVELEVAVADARAELERVKAGGGHKKTEDPGETEHLHRELASRDNIIVSPRGAAKAQAPGAPGFSAWAGQASRTKPKETKRRAGELNDDDAEQGTAQAKKRTRLSSWKHNTIASLEQDLKLCESQPHALKARRSEAETAQAAPRITELEQDLHARDVEIAALKAQLTAANARNRALGAAKGRMTAQINSLLGVKAEARAKGEEVAGLQRHLDDLMARLEGEIKRRLAAEAMLGPDGKRCRKCHPLVISLDESDGEQDG